MFNRKKYQTPAPQGDTLDEANRMLQLVWEERNLQWEGRDFLRGVCFVLLAMVIFLLFV